MYLYKVDLCTQDLGILLVEKLYNLVSDFIYTSENL